jgi:hypothetical protein
MARESKIYFTDRLVDVISMEDLKRFEALVRADEREAFNKERQQYADWLDEAAADIEDWGMYASEYLQKKWDLPDQVQDYKNRALAIRAKVST